MRQINLAGVFYPIHSDIKTRRINPWKAKLGGASLEYSDFSHAELEEYFDFRNGVGKKRGVGSDARLDWSEGIDFSVEGQAVLGPKVTTASTITALSAPTIVNADFETDVSPTPGYGWTQGVGTWGRTAAQAHGGTYSWEEGTITAGDHLYQDATGYILGAEYTVTAWIKCINAADTMKIGWHYGAGETFGSAVGSTDWVQITHTATLPSTATQMRIKIQCAVAGAGTDVYVDDAAISVTALGTLTPTKFIDFESNTYCIGDIAVLKWNTVSSEWDIVALYSNPIDAIVATDSTDSYLVVSSASDAIYSTNGTTWIDFPDSKCMGYLAYYDTKLRAIDTDGLQLHSSAANNIDGTWTEFNLSGDFGTIYDLFEGKLLADGTPTLYMCGTEGLFTIDTTNEVAYKQEVSYPPVTFAGHVGKYWNANVWVATGYGILKVAPSVATYVGTDQDDGLPSGSQGKVYDFATVNNWLVFCVNGGSTDESSIFKRNSTLGGNLQVYTTSAANKAITCLHHSPSSLYTNGRLWFGEGTDIKYMMFPDTTHNVKQIATYEYVDDSGYGTLPIFRKLAAIPKTALGVAAITKSCDATEKIEVYYGLNGATATTLLGTFTSSPKPTTLTFGSGLGTAFYTIQFAVKLYRDSTATNSPELESLLFYWLPVPTTILGWSFRIQCTDENAAATIAALEAIRDTQTLVAFYPSGDTAKTSYNVKLTQLGEQIAYEEQGAKEGWLDVQIEEVFSG